jgi:hypothetical protein
VRYASVLTAIPAFLGLDLKEANSICLSSTYGIDASKEKKDACDEASVGTREIEEHIAHFLTKLRELLSSRQRYRSRIDQGIEEVRKKLQEEKTSTELTKAKLKHKEVTLWKIYEEILNPVFSRDTANTIAQNRMVKASTTLSEHAENLKTVLEGQLEFLRTLYTPAPEGCNTFIPRDNLDSDEYLLAMCNTEGSECVDDPIVDDYDDDVRTSSTAMCCCGTNPMASAALQERVDDQSAGTTRKLATKHKGFWICSKSKADSEAHLAEDAAHMQSEFKDLNELDRACNLAEELSNADLMKYMGMVTNKKALEWLQDLCPNCRSSLSKSMDLPVCWANPVKRTHKCRGFSHHWTSVVLYSGMKVKYECENDVSLKHTCHGVGAVAGFYHYMEGYYGWDELPKAGDKYWLVCLGVDLSLIWSIGGPANGCIIINDNSKVVGGYHGTWRGGGLDIRLLFWFYHCKVDDEHTPAPTLAPTLAPTPTPASASEAMPGNDGFSGGEIAGIVIGVLIGTCMCCFCACGLIEGNEQGKVFCNPLDPGY